MQVVVVSCMLVSMSHPRHFSMVQIDCTHCGKLPPETSDTLELKDLLKQHAYTQNEMLMN